MVAVKPAEIRNNQKTFFEKAYEGEDIVVSRPQKHNVVIVSEEKYNEMQQAMRSMLYYTGLSETGVIDRGIVIQDLINHIDKLGEYYVNRVGDTIMITPREDLGDMLRRGAAMLSEDFMKDGRPDEVINRRLDFDHVKSLLTTPSPSDILSNVVG